MDSQNANEYLKISSFFQLGILFSLNSFRERQNLNISCLWNFLKQTVLYLNHESLYKYDGSGKLIDDSPL